MDISLFSDLERLSQTGSFTLAAKQANTSQPSFSRRIRNLEAWVGVTLVDRSRHPVKLTSAGSQILETGLRALASIEQERNQIRAARSLPEKYTITIGEEHSISWRFYTNWMRAFEASYGPILSRLRADDLDHCMRDLKNGDVDFVIAYARADDVAKGDESIVIGKDRLLPVCKPGTDGKPEYDLKNENYPVPFLHFGAATPISRHLEPLLKQYNLIPRLKDVFENSMAGALLIRVREGGGIAWLPESLIEADLASGTLVRTGDDAWTVDLDIRLHRNAAHSNNLTRSVWAFLSTQRLFPQKSGLGDMGPKT